MDAFGMIIAICLGLVAGSFFNVVIVRLPRNESIVRPGSHCPKCGRPIRPYENIPVLSFLLLRGRCAGCRQRISLQYPLVEAATAMLSIIAYAYLVKPQLASLHSAPAVAMLAMQLIVLFLMIPIAMIDAVHYIIPDRLTLPFLCAAVLVSFLPGGISPLHCGLGILAGGGSLFAAGIIGEYLFKKGEAMGGGDVKLMALAGAVFGWKIALLTIVFAAVAGSIAGLVLFIFKKLSKSHTIPFGPFLGLGLWTAFFLGDAFIRLYQSALQRLFL
jgi:leader peptidase (prepilin peptidase) / N-methyltransferase